MPLDNHIITLASSTRIEAEIARRGIRLRGKVERFGACLRCGGRDRFSVNTKKQVWNCRGCEKGGDVIDLAMHLDGCDFATAVHTLAGTDPSRPAPKPDPVRIAEAQAKAAQAELEEFIDEQERFFKAMKIWHDAVSIEDTLAWSYLTRYRRLDVPDGFSGPVLRYHPVCPFGRGTHPCMIALVRSIETNAHQAIHRTALNPDGSPVKIDGATARKALGLVGGGAIKLSEDAEVTIGLTIGEGLETTIKGMMSPIWFRPAWSLISAGNIAAFPVLAGIESLTILVDHDRPDRNGRRAGQAAATECAHRWITAGREVIPVIPLREGYDMADVASHRQHDGCAPGVRPTPRRRTFAAAEGALQK
jgi:putative DNA primase/helicase